MVTLAPALVSSAAVSWVRMWVWVSIVRSLAISSPENLSLCDGQEALECRSRASRRKPLLQPALWVINEAPLPYRKPNGFRTQTNTERARSGLRTTPWCAARPLHRRPALPQPGLRRVRALAARLCPHRLGRYRRGARRQGRAGGAHGRGHARGGIEDRRAAPAAERPRRHGTDPAIPPDARGRARALCRRGRGDGRRGNGRPGAGRRRSRHRRIRGAAGGGRSARRPQSRTRRSSIRKRPAMSPSTGRAWSTAPRTSARSTRSSRARACRARQRLQPAPDGRLDGNARRHRLLRPKDRQLHAARLLAERRHRAQPDRAGPRRPERKTARDHRGRRRRLRHEDAGLSGISGGAASPPRKSDGRCSGCRRARKPS